MPYLRHSSPADNPAACSFSTLMICSSVNLLLRMSVSLGNGLYPKTGAFKGSRSSRAAEGDSSKPWPPPYNELPMVNPKSQRSVQHDLFIRASPPSWYPRRHH